MLIKAVSAKGDAIPYSAEESLKYAVQYGVKTKNNPDETFWVNTASVSKEHFQAHNDVKTGKWSEAFATGYCMVGKTCNKKDRFHKEKKYFFDIHYKLDKDEIGAPDLKIIKFDLVPVETNPAKNIGKIVTTKPTDAPVVSGELKPEKTDNADVITTQSAPVETKTVKQKSK